MGAHLHVVDAFTSQPFAGNPAAVCQLESARDEAWMQAVASEMNLSETAFLVPIGPLTWSLRWFTPGGEVDLCGHATLASTHVLSLQGHLPHGQTARFTTRSGMLSAHSTDDGWIELDFPSEAPEEADPPPELIEGLALTEPARWVGRNRLDYVVELADEAAVRAVEPDQKTLVRLGARGAMVTAPAGETLAERGYDFVSRYFAPAFGIDEDPVTGSAHCALGPFWAAKLGRDELLAYQASARGGTVRVMVRKTETGGRVGLGGQAVLVSRIELLV